MCYASAVLNDAHGGHHAIFVAEQTAAVGYVDQTKGWGQADAGEQAQQGHQHNAATPMLRGLQCEITQNQNGQHHLCPEQGQQEQTNDYRCQRCAQGVECQRSAQMHALGLCDAAQVTKQETHQQRRQDQCRAAGKSLTCQGRASAVAPQSAGPLTNELSLPQTQATQQQCTSQAA